MSSNFTTIKLAKPLVEAARAEADLLHRSIASQVEHWAAIGRAFESTPGFTLDRVRAALAGRYDAVRLAPEEREIFDDLLGEAMETMQTPAAQEFWGKFARQPNTDL